MILLVFFVLLVSQSHLGDGGMRRLQMALGAGKGKAELGAVPCVRDPVASWRAVMTKAGTIPDVVIERYGDGVKATFDGSVFFPRGDTQLLPPAQVVLRELILQAGKFQSHIDVNVVAGCSPGAEGVEEPAWELTIRRASALQRYLSGEGGVPAGRVYTVARGASCAPDPAGRSNGNGNVIVVLQ
jgi:flagellar motor protein MotB